MEFLILGSVEGREGPQHLDSLAIFYRRLGHRVINCWLKMSSWPCREREREREREGVRELTDSVQTIYIVKGEAQKSPLFWRFSGDF